MSRAFIQLERRSHKDGQADKRTGGQADRRTVEQADRRNRRTERHGPILTHNVTSLPSTYLYLDKKAQNKLV